MDDLNISIGPKPVPNEFPTIDVPYRLAVVGEAPGEDEVNFQKPFVGKSGQFLTNLLGQCGAPRHGCFIGNICQHRPPSNQIARFAWDGPEIREGLAQLQQDLDKFGPNCTLLLGQTALRAAGVEDKISSFRGTIFDSPVFGKCVASYHPAAVLRQYNLWPLLKFDIRRARTEAEDPDLNLPQRTATLGWSVSQITDTLDNWPAHKEAALDIEGGINGMPCLSIADSPTTSFIIDFVRLEDDPRIYRSLARWLARSDIPKVLQNSLYDNFVLSHAFKMPIAGVVDDTMLSGWELYPELPKALGVQASIYTREPYYKDERTSDDRWTFLEYCCKDSMVTLEIAQQHRQILDGPRRAHYDFNVACLRPLLYSQLRGIRFDSAAAKVMHDKLTVVAEELLSRIHTKTGTRVNPNSPPQMKDLLYVKLGYEKQYKIEGGRKTNTVTADADAILKLFRKYKSDILYDILLWRQSTKLRSYADILPDPDGRVRGSYNVVGTETGRLSCRKSPTGTGTNLQTIPKALRHCFIADPGHYFFQCDLEGADGWTVACHAANQGDPAMLNDLRAGVKPAKCIAMMRLHGPQVASLDPEAIHSLIAQTDIPPYLYMACKRIQHGSCYGMGERLMSSQIYKDSYRIAGEPVYVAPKDCKELQNLFFLRYRGVRLWQQWVEHQLRTKGTLDSASGTRRMFFGRRKDSSTIQAALSQEPQANTTYVTNLALLNLWRDPANRQPNGSLLVEPLHQVHDAICGQFPAHRADECCALLRRWFNNPITIADQPITIPFEGGYGPSWGELDNEI